jgi:tether containing UBX domain for GLUT4
MLRYANLPPGANLYLVQGSRSPTVISVALQLPASEDNARLTDKFPSNTSFWQILRRFESGAAGASSARHSNYIFTQRGVPQMSAGASGAGRLNFEMPVIQVMNRELATVEDLQKTLAQIGLNSGSALLRLSFRDSGKPLEEAMEDITRYFKSEAENEAAETPALLQATSASENPANLTTPG